MEVNLFILQQGFCIDPSPQFMRLVLDVCLASGSEAALAVFL